MLCARVSLAVLRGEAFDLSALLTSFAGVDPWSGSSAPGPNGKELVMVRSPSMKLLAAAVVVSFAAVTAVAGAGNTTHRPGIHNGVITACVEPPTKAIRPRRAI